MGWNSWNMFGSNIHEDSIRETADALVATGLQSCGYEYIVIDDCWSVKSGRDGRGDLIADPAKFPSGIAALADYVHGLCFKLGIYSDAAETTCAGYPGSLGHEERDAALWASWGIDFLKYDYCAAPNDQETAIARYGKMGAALQASGREILFSLCEWGGRSPHLWGQAAGGQMWRVSGDVFDSWVNVWMESWKTYGIGVDVSIDIADALSGYGGPGRWNDLDMLVVGLKGKGHISGGGLSFLEYQTHMSVWCMACSPLMIGCDVRKMDAETAGLLTNRAVLAVNQDPLGVPARRVKRTDGCEVWRKPLVSGAVAVALINRGAEGRDMSVTAKDIGMLDAPKRVRDLWSGADLQPFGWDFAHRVEPHQTILLEVAP